MKKFFAFLILAVGLLALAVTAEEESSSDDKTTTFDGQLVCLSCDLKKTEGAKSACGTYGCNHVLKTNDNRYVSFLPNDYSRDLASDKYHNKDISVTGVYFVSANMLDVESFTIDGEKQGWCDHCEAMDNCPYKGQGNL
jgi:hypothetical protein